LTTEELEKKLEAEEWEKRQKYYADNPNKKKNNYFMNQLNRGDSIQYDLDDTERKEM
jgi:hypothetical protein